MQESNPQKLDAVCLVAVRSARRLSLVSEQLREELVIHRPLSFDLLERPRKTLDQAPSCSL
jgi:hypothetical protein